MLGQDRDDHRRIFGALALVNCDGVGGNQNVEFAKVVDHRATVVTSCEFAGLWIEVHDIANVATSLS
jgi:hypothetical protein